MNLRSIALGVGGAAVVLGTTFGLAGLASADTPAPTPSTAQTQTQTRQGYGNGPCWTGDATAPRGQANGAGYGATAMATRLADKLGVSADAVRDALVAYHTDHPAQTRGVDLTDEQRAAQHDALAAYLADKLGVDQAKVVDALDALHDERVADRPMGGRQGRGPNR